MDHRLDALFKTADSPAFVIETPRFGVNGKNGLALLRLGGPRITLRLPDQIVNTTDKQHIITTMSTLPAGC